MASNSTPETAPGPAAGTAAPPESDKTAAEAPASSAERAIIKVGEHSFRTREDIAAYVSSLPPAEQYTAQTAIRDNLLQHHSGIEDLIFDFYSYTESSKAYEKANISREAFLEDNERLIEEVRTITAKRDVRKESLKRLNKYLTTPRGLALLSTILADMSISGKNFIADLATIFSKVPAEEGVGHLNAAILERNRRPKTKGMRPRAGIMPADAARAKGRITQGEQWAEEDVALDELKSMRLRYGASGLLEEGSAAVAARPHFEGEGEGRRSGAGPSQQVGEGVSVTGSTVAAGGKSGIAGPAEQAKESPGKQKETDTAEQSKGAPVDQVGGIETVGQVSKTGPGDQGGADHKREVDKRDADKHEVDKPAGQDGKTTAAINPVSQASETNPGDQDKTTAAMNPPGQASEIEDQDGAAAVVEPAGKAVETNPVDQAKTTATPASQVEDASKGARDSDTTATPVVPVTVPTTSASAMPEPGPAPADTAAPTSVSTQGKAESMVDTGMQTTAAKHDRSPSPETPSKRHEPEVDEYFSWHTATANTSSCDCDMDVAWKNTVEEPAHHASFLELRERIRPVVEGGARPCLWHLQRLCQQLHMHHEQPALELVRRLGVVWERSAGDSSNIRIVSSSETYPFFVPSPELERIREQHNLGVFRFAPATTAAMAPGAVVPKAAQPDKIADLATQDFTSFRGFYSWTVTKDKPLSKAFTEEARMYQHHLRHAPDHGGLVPSMYYSLLQQLVRQDPALYEAHVSLRTDGATRLMAVPLSARFFDTGSVADVTLYEGDTRAIRANTCSTIHDEVVIGGNEGVELLAASASDVRAWLEGGDETRDYITALAPLPAALAWVAPAQNNDLVCARAGTPMRYRFTATEPLLSVSSGLVALTDTDVLENGMRLSDVAYYHASMTLPKHSRRGDISIPGRFPAAVELTDLGPLSGALVGRMSWDSPAVQEQRQLVLTGTKHQVQQFYTTWRKHARAQVLHCWKIVQERERLLYGERSYFACQEAGRDIVDLTADDEVYGEEVGEA